MVEPKSMRDVRNRGWGFIVFVKDEGYQNKFDNIQTLARILAGDGCKLLRYEKFELNRKEFKSVFRGFAC